MYKQNRGILNSLESTLSISNGRFTCFYFNLEVIKYILFVRNPDASITEIFIADLDPVSEIKFLSSIAFVQPNDGYHVNATAHILSDLISPIGVIIRFKVIDMAKKLQDSLLESLYYSEKESMRKKSGSIHIVLLSILSQLTIVLCTAVSYLSFFTTRRLREELVNTRGSI